MTIRDVVELYQNAYGVVIAADEESTLQAANENQTIPFYVVLRQRLLIEYAEKRAFALSARQLAAAEFLCGARDRKVYLRLIKDLLSLGLLVVVRYGGIDLEGRFTPRLYVFTSQSCPRSNVISIWANSK